MSSDTYVHTQQDSNIIEDFADNNFFPNVMSVPIWATKTGLLIKCRSMEQSQVAMCGRWPCSDIRQRLSELFR
jgi:hypothetical protein